MNVDNVALIRIVSGVLAAAVLAFLIYRRRTRVQ
jgi:hypothetical protein